MKIKYGKGKTKCGPGVSVKLTGDEVAMAIAAWLVAHGVHIKGPHSISVNNEICRKGEVYVDPSGFVIANGEKIAGCGH